MSRKPAADIAILCPIPEEWNSMCSRLKPPIFTPNESLPTKQGRIAGQSVVCVNSGKGEGASAASLQSVLSLWTPKKVLLVGVAGGFPTMNVHRGDVVVARYIYNFDFGKLTSGDFIRRPDEDVKVDRNLLNCAEMVMKAEGEPWKSGITLERPDGEPLSKTKAHDGYIASCNKTVDDPDHVFFESVRQKIQEIHAVEMEGSGAGAAICIEQSRRSVSFIMIRGISDEPHRTDDPSYGSKQRAAWKLYAADVAAAFTHQMILALSESSGDTHSTISGPSIRLDPLSAEQMCDEIHFALDRSAEHKSRRKSSPPPCVAVLHGENFPENYLRRLLTLFDQHSIKWQCPSLGRETYAYAKAMNESIAQASYVLFLVSSRDELSNGWAAYAKSITSEHSRVWIPRVVMP